MRRVEKDAVGRTQRHAPIALWIPRKSDAGSEVIVMVRRQRKRIWNAAFACEIDSGRRIREYFTLLTLVEPFPAEEWMFLAGVVRCEERLPTQAVVQR